MASHQINYRPLDTSKSEIRVLRIEPRTSELDNKGPSEPVKCTLEHISLDSKPIYHALSYTWDTHGLDTHEPSSSEIDNPTIILDGQEVSVKRNLLLALTQFREFFSLPADVYFVPFPPGIQLWVDAISINQDDVSERNQQILKMRQIYQNAEIVNVWLGPELQDSNLGMEIAHGLQQRVRARGPTKAEEEWINPLMRAKLQDQDNHESWVSLSNIFLRPYWQRVWIVQELVTNMRAYAHVGSKFSLLMPLLASASTMEEADGLAPGLLDKSSFVDARVIVDDRWSFMNPEYEGHHLFDILCNYRHHLCSEPKDKVYGFASLARPYNGIDLLIDDDEPPGIVFENAAKFIIDGTERLEVICAAELSNCRCNAGAHAKVNVPSWVPNWSCIPLAWDRMRFETRIPWNAALDSKAVVDFSPDNKLLTCKGLMIGLVERIHLLPHEELSQSRTLTEFHSLLTFLLDNSSLHDPPKDRQEEASPTILSISKRLWEIYFNYLGMDDLLRPALTRENFKDLCSDFLSRSLDEAFFEEHGEDVKKIFNILGERGVFFTKLAITGLSPTEHSHENSSAIGACPPCARGGDVVVLLYGCKTLVLLRTEGNRYRMICAASLNDYMNGEAMGKFDEREFVIH